MVEGGGHVAAGLLTSELADRIAWFRAAAVMGDDGIAGIGALGLQMPEEMPRFRRLDVRRIGDDLLETYGREAG
jgi:diaminohydroxyphosphoribosylaminopyrimidine deaminase/5-amino-6-(5-phosphoribosylamino)uracil reductase